MRKTDHNATIPMADYNYLMKQSEENRDIKLAIATNFIINIKEDNVDINIPNLIKDIKQYLPEHLQNIKYNYLGV